jgi:hypothetical protein
MGQPYSRISENVLFILLAAALIGWVAAPVAADLQPASAVGAWFALDQESLS